MSGFSYNSDASDSSETVQRWVSIDRKTEIVQVPSQYGIEQDQRHYGLFHDGNLIVTATFDYVTKYYWAEFVP